MICFKLPNSAKVCFFTDEVECLWNAHDSRLSQNLCIVNTLLAYANLVSFES